MTFKSERFAGHIPFVAQATKEEWIITEFRLPQYRMRVVRGNDGVWSEQALKDGPTGASKARERTKEAPAAPRPTDKDRH